MIGRVTQQGLQRASLQQLQGNLAAMAALQERLNSGKVISKPSDDPAGTVDAMRVRADQRATMQYVRNVEDGNSWLTTIDSALGSSLSLLRRARDLTVQGANSGALSQSSRASIAAELRATAESLLAEANTEYLGRSVFAGTSTEAAFVREADGAYRFTGTGTPVERRLSDTATVRVDSDGAAVFGVTVPGPDGEPATRTVFELLEQVATKLEAGEDVGAHLDDIDAHLDAFLAEVGSVGTRHNQVLRAQEALAAREVALESQRSAVEDADLAETIVELQLQEVSYQAALNATSRVLQPSLLDFLR